MLHDDFLVHKLYYSGVDALKDIIELYGYDMGNTNNKLIYNYEDIELPNGVVAAILDGTIPSITGVGIGYLSPAGVQYLLHVEGWSGGSKANFRAGATAVQQSCDRAGVITVGPGCTNLANKLIKEGQHYSFEEICGFFSEEINKLSGYVDKYCPQILNFGQGAIDMIVSLGYNGGCSWIMKMKDCHNVQDVVTKIAGGPVTANGVVLSGLVKRRAGEAKIAAGTRDDSDACKIYYGEINEMTKAIVEQCGGSINGTPGLFGGKYSIGGGNRKAAIKALGFSDSPTKEECAAAMTTVAVDTINGIKHVTVHKNLASKVKMLFADLKRANFNVKEIGGYCFRTINNPSHPGSSTLSMHSFGCAIDINWSHDNPFIKNGKPQISGDDNSNGIVRTMNSTAVKIFAKYGFGWGGTYGDYMHFSTANGG